MKIIHITPSYKPAFVYGGPIKSVALLCEMLAKKGQHIEVWTTNANGPKELDVTTAKPIRINGVTVRYFNRITRDHTQFSPSLLWHVFQNATRGSNHLLFHIHSWWNVTSLLSCLIAKINQIPIVLSPRGMLTEYSLSNRNSRYKLMIHNLLGSRLLRSVTIHATTEQEKHDIQKIHKGKIKVIPNLVNNLPVNSGKAMKYHTTQNPHCFHMLFLARIEKKKGLEHLLRALEQLPFLWRLSIAGSGEPGYICSIKKLIADLNIQSSVDWLGQVNGCNKYKLLSQHDLLVLFSYNENFANAVTESLSVGTPVAISDQVGLSPFVLHHDLGWVTNINVTNISQTLISARQDHQKRNRIKQIAPRLISQHFSTKGILDQYLNLYRQSL